MTWREKREILSGALITPDSFLRYWQGVRECITSLSVCLHMYRSETTFLCKRTPNNFNNFTVTITRNNKAASNRGVVAFYNYF